MRNPDNDLAEIERLNEEEMWKWEYSLGKLPENSLVKFVVKARLHGFFPPVYDNGARALVMEWVKEYGQEAV